MLEKQQIKKLLSSVFMNRLFIILLDGPETLNMFSHDKINSVSFYYLTTGRSNFSYDISEKLSFFPVSFLETLSNEGNPNYFI